MKNQPNVIYSKFRKPLRPTPSMQVFMPSQQVADSELVFSQEQCNWVVQYGQQLQGNDASVGNGGVVKEIRDAKVHSFPLNQHTEPLYQKVMMIVEKANEQFDFDIDGIPHEFQLLYYGVGGHYNYHVDVGGQNPDRKISLVVMLSDPADYEGGELMINDGGEHKLPREQGMVATFPSYTMHTVNPITKGHRWSLVTWITGKPFR